MSLLTPSHASGGPGVPPLRWWSILPISRSMQPTDVCTVCGHCRDRHQFAGYASKCIVRGCECGPQRYPFHIAGLPQGMARDTVTVDGKVTPIDQPAPPGKPLDG